MNEGHEFDKPRDIGTAPEEVSLEGWAWLRGQAKAGSYQAYMIAGELRGAREALQEAWGLLNRKVSGENVSGMTAMNTPTEPCGKCGHYLVDAGEGPGYDRIFFFGVPGAFECDVCNGSTLVSETSIE